MPASTLGALSFSASSSGTCSISASQSHDDGSAGEVLPAATDRRRDARHRVERVGAGAHRLEPGMQPDPLLGGAGAGQVGVVLALVHLQQVGRGVVDGGAGAQPLGPVDEHGRLLGAPGRRTGPPRRPTPTRRRRRRAPAASTTGALVISADTRATATAVSATRTASSGVSTTPDAKPQDPPWMTRTAKPRSSWSLAPWSTPSRTAERLVADPLEPEVRMAGPELPRPLQGSIAETAVGECGERRIQGSARSCGRTYPIGSTAFSPRERV